MLGVLDFKLSATRCIFKSNTSCRAHLRRRCTDHLLIIWAIKTAHRVLQCIAYTEHEGGPTAVISSQSIVGVGKRPAEDLYPLKGAS